MPEIYKPAEDSYLMSETLRAEVPKLLKLNPNLKFLEIGIGSGINLETVLKSGVKIKNITGSDVNENSVKNCRKLGFNVITSNLFQNIKGKFNVIVFNPPYLPFDKQEPRNSRLETTGGKLGNEIAIRFLKQAKKHLSGNGKIFIVTSSLSEEVDFNKIGYRKKLFSMKDLFFEKLFLWELTSRVN